MLETSSLDYLCVCNNSRLFYLDSNVNFWSSAFWMGSGSVVSLFSDGPYNCLWVRGFCEFGKLKIVRVRWYVVMAGSEKLPRGFFHVAQVRNGDFGCAFGFFFSGLVVYGEAEA